MREGRGAKGTIRTLLVGVILLLGGVYFFLIFTQRHVPDRARLVSLLAQARFTEELIGQPIELHSDLTVVHKGEKFRIFTGSISGTTGRGEFVVRLRSQTDSRSPSMSWQLQSYHLFLEDECWVLRSQGEQPCADKRMRRFRRGARERMLNLTVGLQT
ncbi:hypothetical protein MRY87_12945 [bacterium]|nr:hypothetical protein [bacterium]